MGLIKPCEGAHMPMCMQHHTQHVHTNNMLARMMTVLGGIIATRSPTQHLVSTSSHETAMQHREAGMSTLLQQETELLQATGL